jgi:hypothetical protein
MRRRPIARILSPLLFALSLPALAPPAAAQCVAGRFFVSTQVPGFFPALAPPVGFCVVDNGAGDLNPSPGVIELNQTVNSPVYGFKQFSGRAEIVNGTAITGGQTGFGVKLTRLVETTQSTPSGIVPGIPIFVQNTFSSNIPTNVYAAVTTSIQGTASVPGSATFLINDLGSWSGIPAVSSGHAIPISGSSSFAPPPAVSPFAPGLVSPEQVTYEYISTARQSGTQVDVSGSAIVNAPGNSSACTVGTFFVSTFVENFFTNLMPPAGFCIPDNGPGDADPAVGSIVFNNQTVNDPIGRAVKRFSGRATVIPGSAAVGGPGTTGFGVRLTDFQELTLSAPLTIGGSGIPIFVQNTFSPGIPASAFGRVTTTLDGFADEAGEIFSIADLGSWAGVPVVSSGHILGVPPYRFAPPSIASPAGAGSRASEVVTYQFIDTNLQSGTSVFLPGSGQAVANEGPGPAAGQTLALQPATSTNAVGDQHTVTATLSPALSGVTVTFNVLGGPNAGASGTAVTDAFGNAPFTYTDNGGAGTDAIQATANGVASSQVTKEWVPDPDPPVCELYSSGTGYIEILVQDELSGLASVVVRTSNNASVGVPGVPVGTTDPLVVLASKVDFTKSSQVGLRVTDVDGNVIDCDPVQVTVERTTGRPQPVTLTGLPAEEGRITVRNGSPGVKNLEINVNGWTWRLTGMSDGAERTLDVSPAMRPGDGNTITVTPQGKPGGSADLVISD